MAIPRAVEQAAQRAEEMYRQAYQGEDDQEVKEEQPEQVSETEEPETNPEQDEQTKAEAEVEAPQKEDHEPVEAKKSESPEVWEQRYKTLSGKYSSEVPRLAADNKELRNQLETLKAEIEGLKLEAERPKAPLISDEDKEKYGEELVDFVQRAVKSQTVEKEHEIEQLKKQLESFTTETNKNSEVSFFERLTELVPDWPTINDDESFHKWLDERDTFSGKRRQDLLQDAEGAKDAPRVATFFNTWRESTQQVSAKTTSALETQVAPESKKVKVTPPGKRYFTRAEVADFYSKVRRGEIKAKDQMRIENEIHEALVEGRVR